MTTAFNRPPVSQTQVFKRIWIHLSPGRRRQVMLLAVPIFFAALAEMVSVGAVVPFLGVMASPETMFKSDLVVWAAGRLGVEEAAGLRLPLTILFCAAVIGANALRLLLLWFNSRLAYAITHDVSVQVYNRSLYMPYSMQVARNSSALLGGVVKTRAVTKALNTLFSMASGLWIGVFIVAALLLINPAIALAGFFGFGAVYLLTVLATRRRLKRNGKIEAAAHTARLRAMQDGVGGIRDILLDNNQSLFTHIFSKIDRRLNKSEASTLFLSSSPRFVIEPIGVTLIVIIAYSLSMQPGGFSAIIPTLGALALGAQRLLPVLQQIYSGWAVLRANVASLGDLVEFLDQPIGDEYNAAPPAPLNFEKKIEFRNVCFRYHPEAPEILRAVNLVISKGQRIGILGATGSGKSTLFDLLMGLLSPTEGEILIDGQQLQGVTRLAWQRVVAHVPQSIYLADASIAENIAFGVGVSNIDMDRVRSAARQAQIANFIEAKEGAYSASVGERGVRLSGGQRQRIGIARALYKNAQVLVFDEATSALDRETEKSVMEAIEGLGRDLTICLIAHRLTTLSNCDVVVRLERGEIVSEGTYEDVLRGQQHEIAT